LQRKKDQLAKLESDRAKHESNASSYNIKAQKAKDAATRAKTPSIINNKLREVDRNARSAAKEQEKVASLNKKIAQKNKEVQKAQSKIEREEERIRKREKEDQKKRQKQHQEEIKRITDDLAEQKKAQEKTQMDIERLKMLPESITIAFFAANPLDQNKLRLDEEVRSIEENIRKSEHRDSIRLRSFWAVRPNDILQKLNESNPEIVHFSGHGSDRDELVLQSDNGDTKLVSKESIVHTMTTLSDHIRIVFFNTCYSHEQAKAVVKIVEAAIGMNNSISDDAAREFAAKFYSSIGFGLSVKTAFEQAKASLMLQGISEDNTPELFVQEGMSPDEIIIVRPEELE
jgi:hypothetical protein